MSQDSSRGRRSLVSCRWTGLLLALAVAAGCGEESKQPSPVPAAPPAWVGCWFGAPFVSVVITLHLEPDGRLLWFESSNGVRLDLTGRWDPVPSGGAKVSSLDGDSDFVREGSSIVPIPDGLEIRSVTPGSNGRIVRLSGCPR